MEVVEHLAEGTLLVGEQRVEGGVHEVLDRGDGDAGEVVDEHLEGARGVAELGGVGVGVGLGDGDDLDVLVELHDERVGAELEGRGVLLRAVGEQLAHHGVDQVEVLVRQREAHEQQVPRQQRRRHDPCQCASPVVVCQILLSC